jgi:lysophospholipase L1-like esterase
MPNQYVLDSLECAAVRSNIKAYNTAIASLASKYEMAFVDMYQYFQDLQKGIANDGVHYSPEFIKGGFFSLDGFHPNQKGYGLISNEFLRSINLHYHANVPETLCKACKGIRFP